MIERERMLDNARKRYIFSEISQDLNEALRREDYKSAKTYAGRMYEVLFELCENQTGKEKEAEKSRLEDLSDFIDFINEQSKLGGQKQWTLKRKKNLQQKL